VRTQTNFKIPAADFIPSKKLHEISEDSYKNELVTENFQYHEFLNTSVIDIDVYNGVYSTSDCKQLEKILKYC